jgi:hypothetical protein
MTCRLNFCSPNFLFSEHALQSEVPFMLYALCNLLGPPSLNLPVRLYPSTYNCSLPEIIWHQDSNAVNFQPELS